MDNDKRRKRRKKFGIRQDSNGLVHTENSPFLDAFASLGRVHDSTALFAPGCLPSKPRPPMSPRFRPAALLAFAALALGAVSGACL